MEIVSLQIGRPQIRNYMGMQINTAMDKQKIESVTVRFERLEGDDVGNKKHHGGKDRVICFYPYEHYPYWENTYSKKLPLPAFGENLTVRGMTEKDMYIGDILKIGETVIQITQGRVPCATISMFNAEKDFLRNVKETGFCGYFARVLEEGQIREGDQPLLLERSENSVSVFYATHVLLNGMDGIQGIESVLSVSSLADEWKKKLEKLKERQLGI
ncbi:MOSC domain-containing protein [Bacillus massiliglaciei]|uniref:MOSC domain-containing protein n=1 Tax=Bacillus massiliglaciei TaxID=1816693 RepID=UPI000AADA8FF|nr:MOSC domain-containing protein [Bacillus massiliglaciei]